MVDPTISGFQGPYGFPERYFPQEGEAEPLGEGAYRETYTSDLGSRTFAKGALHTATPSQTAWKKETLLGHIIAFFQKGVHLFDRLLPNRPPEMDFRLFSDIVGASQRRNLPDADAPLSKVLQWKLSWLKREAKHRPIEGSLLAEMEQCRKWSQRLEEIALFKYPQEKKESSDTISRRKKGEALDQLSQEISQRLKKLPNEKSLLIPGGWRSDLSAPSVSILYRVTKNTDGTFEFTMISLDPDIETQTTFGAIGKTKISPETVFTKIPEKEITSTAWLQRFLGLQVPGYAEKPPSRKIWLNLLRPIYGEGRIVRKTPPQAFKTERFRAEKAHNVAALIDRLSKDLRKGGRAQRENLWETFGAFSDFYRVYYDAFPENEVLQSLLQEGVEILSRKASLLHQRGQVTKEELIFFNKQCAVVERHLDAIRSPQGKKRSPFRNPKGPRFQLPSPKIQSLTLPKEKKFGPPQEIRTEKKELPSTESPLKAADPSALGEISPKTLPQLIEECTALFEKQQHAHLQNRIVEIFHRFPFPDPPTQENPTIFNELSKEEKYGLMENLASLATLLGSSVKETRLPLPDQLLQLTKIEFILFGLLIELEECPRFVQQHTDWLIMDVIDKFSKLSKDEKTWGISKLQPSDDGISWIEDLEKCRIWGQFRSAIRDHGYEGPGKIPQKDKEQLSKIYLSDQSIFTYQWYCQRRKKTKREIEAYATFTQALNRFLLLDDKSKATAYTLNKTKRQWSRPYANKFIKQTALVFELGSTYMMGEEKITWEPSLSGVDRSSRSVDRILQEVGMSRQDLTDLLKVHTENFTVPETFAFFAEKPSLLEIPDVRAWLDKALFAHPTRANPEEQKAFDEEFKKIDKEELTAIVESKKLRKLRESGPRTRVGPSYLLTEIENDRIFRDSLPSYLKGQIELFRSQGKTASLVFITDILGKMKQECRTFGSEEVRAWAGKLPDSTNILREIGEESLEIDSPFAKDRHTLWRETILTYEKAQEIAPQDAERLVKAFTLLRGSNPDPWQRDYAKDQRVLRIKERLAPLFQQFCASEPMRDALLDTALSVQQWDLPRQGWSGSFPVYRAGDCEIDLMQGITRNLRLGTTNEGFPSSLQSDSIVRSTLTKEEIDRSNVQVKEEKEGKVYYLRDAQGNQVRIASSKKGVEVHKKLLLRQKIGWWQPIPQKNLFPEGEKENRRLTLIQLFFTFLKKSLGITSPPFPEFLKHPDYRFYVQANDPGVLYVCDTKGTPLYLLRMQRGRKTSRLKEIALLHGQTDSFQWHSIDSLSDSSLPFWLPFSRFEKRENILLLREKGKITSVHLPRYQLSFTKKGEELICTHPEYEGWVVDPSSVSATTRKGIRNALLLHDPKDPRKKKVLVPEYSIEMSMPDATVCWEMLRLLCASRLKKRELIPSFKKPLTPPWKYNKERETPSFLTFAIDPDTHEWETTAPDPFEAFLYLTTVSVWENHPERALGFLQQAIRSLGTRPRTASEAEKIQESLAQARDLPSGHALHLQALLMLREHGEQREELERAIAKSYIDDYLSQGHKIRAELRLTTGQEQLCQECLHKYLPDQAAEILPPLRKRLPVAIQKKEKPLFTKKEREALTQDEQKHLAEGLSFVLAKNEIDRPNIPLLKKTDIRNYFPYFYKKTTEGGFSEKEKQHLRFLVKELRGEERTTDLNDVLIEYLDVVLEANSQETQTIAWPRLSIDLSSRRETITPILETFFAEMEKVVTQQENSLQQALPMEPGSPPTLRQLEQIGAYFDQLKTTEKIGAELPLEAWLDKLATIPKKTLDLQKESKGDALYTQEKIKDFFEEKPFRAVPPLIDFTAVQTTEKAVEAAGKKLNEEIKKARQEGKKRREQEIKSEEVRLVLEQQLRDKKKTLREEVEKQQKELFAWLSPATPKHQLERLGGHAPQIVWEDILLAFLQNDRERMEKMLPPEVTREEFTKRLRDYLLLATQEKRLENAIQTMETMAPKAEGISGAQSQKLFKILTDERQYDPEKNPELLFFEFYLGYLVRDDQLDLILDLVNNPDCVRQAITGAGKTSVILVLTSLLKAKGDNLVTVQFPAALYEENLSSLQRQLGKIFQRNTYAFRFSPKDPLVVEEGGRKQSLFTTILTRMRRTITEKGCMITTKESLQSLEALWIRQMDYFDRLPEESWKEIEMEHFQALTEIIALLRERQEQIIDEFDSAMDPKEKFEMTLGLGVDLPDFLIDVGLDLYKKLLAYDAAHQKDGKALGVKENLQGERYGENGEEALAALRKEVIDEWKDKSPDGVLLEAYLQGENEDFLHTLNDRWSEEERDRLTAQKDYLSTFLPLALKKSGFVNYIRSENGHATVPCLRTNIPREGSKPDEILEQLCYTIQDYTQNGVTKAIFQEWVRKQKTQAETEMARKRGLSFQETDANQFFHSFFPNRDLSRIDPKKIDDLFEELQADEERVRRFLRMELKLLTIATKKISLSKHNLVSMSQHTSGASATMGCLAGLHSSIQTEGAEKEGVVGEMIGRMYKKSEATGNAATFDYNPSDPDSLIQKGVDERQIQSFVDAASAFRGLPNEALARSLFQKLPKDSPIQGVVFFEEQKMKVFTKKGAMPLAQADLKPSACAMALSQSESRGADVKLGAKNRVLITFDPNKVSLEALLQAVGRLRGEDQECCWAVPEGVAMADVDAILRSAAQKSALDNAENLFRAKKEELRDIVRNDLLNAILDQCRNEKNPKVATQNARDIFREVQSDKKNQFLVTERDVDYKEPGRYFALNKHLTKKDKQPKDVLEEMRKELAAFAEQKQLAKAKESLEKMHYPEEIVNQMPNFVVGRTGPSLEQETETENETEVEMELTSQVITMEKPGFPRWLNKESRYYREHTLQSIHPLYDARCRFTENFLPLGRKEYSPPTTNTHRTPYDPIQIPAHWLLCTVGEDGKILELKAVDNLDVTKNTYHTPSVPEGKLRFYYNMRNDEMPIRVEDPTSPLWEKKALLARAAPLVAQWRFREKQMEEARYTEEQWEALQEWLKGDPVGLEKEFVKRLNGEELAAYPTSSLGKLFRTLKSASPH